MDEIMLGDRLHKPYHYNQDLTSEYIDISVELVMEYVNAEKTQFFKFLEKKIDGRNNTTTT